MMWIVRSIHNKNNVSFFNYIIIPGEFRKKKGWSFKNIGYCADLAAMLRHLSILRYFFQFGKKKLHNMVFNTYPWIYYKDYIDVIY